jgi:hypothetical protein
MSFVVARRVRAQRDREAAARGPTANMLRVCSLDD